MKKKRSCVVNHENVTDVHVYRRFKNRSDVQGDGMGEIIKQFLSNKRVLTTPIRLLCTPNRKRFSFFILFVSVTTEIIAFHTCCITVKSPHT